MSASPDPKYDGSPRARIVLGVVPDQPSEVITAAADYAAHFDPELGDRIAAALEDTNVAWSTRALATSPIPGDSPTAESQTGEGEQ
ncbi:hypothetical protein SAMN04489752_3516 [Brevibacterium siliguriense]|uniref:Uncharacterized protein n=1 Tax=Brevibacterium siliguriense TaxID=1136497 RepID=A0A1H1Y1K2_9MICO|nr:hypothetical protein [Brevibacterium siliguriense]SDT15358.1 hypothetical protein SAMN04489752_3516 [Brevibacterium siliguriense]